MFTYEDMSQIEEEEIKIIDSFLPQQLNEEETKKICKEIIKLVLATVVLYIAKTQPQKPNDNIIPPKKPGNPEL